MSCPPRAIFRDILSRCGLEILLKIWNEDPVARPSFSNYYGAEDVESETQYVIESYRFDVYFSYVCRKEQVIFHFFPR